MKTILGASLLCLSISICAMNSSSSSSSSSSSIAEPVSWDNLLAHPLSRVTYIFTLAVSEFAEQKKDAFKLIAQLTARRFKLGSCIDSVTFNHDGTQLAMACTDGKARILDLASGQIIHEFAYSNRVRSVAFNHDGTQLAMTCDDKKSRIFDFNSNKQVHEFTHSDSASRVAFNHDGTQFAIGCMDRKVRIFDLVQNKQIHEFAYSGWIGLLAFNHDGTQLAIGCGDDKVHIFDFVQNKKKCEFAYPDWIDSVALNHNGSRFSIECDDDKTCIFDQARCEEMVKLCRFFQGGLSRQTACNHDGTQLADERYFKVRIFSIRKINSIVNTMSLAHYHLLKAFQTAVLSKKQIHADHAQWQIWESLQKILPEISIKHLEPYILRK